MAPDSRRSARRGLGGLRFSTWRLSCDSAMHGQVQLLGQRLQRARDLGDLLLAAVLALAAAHELQVVDDDELQLGLGLAVQAARLRPQLQDRQRGRVVDVDRRVGQAGRRLGELAELAVGEVAGAHPGQVDARLGAQHAHGELLLRHLEREDARRRTSARSAACSAMFRQKAVLPMLGRPATMIRSEGWSPAVRRSRSANPVGTPVTGCFCSCSRSMVLKASPRSLSMRTNAGRTSRSEMAKMSCSARSSSSFTSWPGS